VTASPLVVFKQGYAVGCGRLILSKGVVDPYLSNVFGLLSIGGKLIGFMVAGYVIQI